MRAGLLTTSTSVKLPLSLPFPPLSLSLLDAGRSRADFLLDIESENSSTVFRGAAKFLRGGVNT